MKKFAYLIMGEYPSVKEGIIGEGKARIVGVPTLEDACETAKKLVEEEGITCIELCGAFGPYGCMKVIEAVENKATVGYVTHLSMQKELQQAVFPNDLRIRQALPEDLPRIEEIYARARAYMKENGNPRQWGMTNWPPRDLLEKDISTGRSYVQEGPEGVLSVFFFDMGKDIEPGYTAISEGSWSYDGPYGVVHRLATDGSAKGAGRRCLQWAMAMSEGHLRVDTHPDNKVMQNLLASLGFDKRGIIFVEEDDDPRYAYEYNTSV